MRKTSDEPDNKLSNLWFKGFKILMYKSSKGIRIQH